MLLGVGCVMKEDMIDFVVGLKFYKKVGSLVEKGELLLIIYVNCEDVIEVE